VNVVDPLLLARKPLQALAHARQIGCFADQAGHGCQIRRHALQFSKRPVLAP